MIVKDREETDLDLSDSLQPITKEEVLDTIRAEIVFGQLRPRERLLENELAARFGVGRYIIRSALTELERIGLIEIRQNRGAVVRDRPTREVEELYEMRELLQREAARKITLPAESSLLDALEKINEDYRKNLEKGALNKVVEANNAFHQTFFAACGNSCLSEAIEHYWQQTAAIHCYAIGSRKTAQRSFAEHTEMIAALREGDREELVRLSVEHMLPALNAYKAAHGGWPDDSK
jgi:DNA-binding GntR family transcriptional regulator